MQIVKVDLPRQYSKFEIHTFADLHHGDKFADLDLIQKRIEYVKKTPNAYAILNGDLTNNATKTSVGDTYSEQLTPMEQVDLTVKLFKPIRDKILVMNSGNHEKRTYLKEGIDLTEIIARELNLDDRYSRSGTLLFLKCGERSAHYDKRQVVYTFYIIHGYGAARKEGAKAIRLADMSSIIDADIYVHSHTHLPITMKEVYFRTDIPNQTIIPVEKLFVNTGAYLDYGGYGEEFELKPGSKSTPVIHLSGKIKEMKATL